MVFSLSLKSSAHLNVQSELEAVFMFSNTAKISTFYLKTFSQPILKTAEK